MSWFSLGNLFGSLGFHDTPKPAPAATPVTPPPDAAPFADALKASLDAQTAALDAQTQATKDAAVAALPQIDSESARVASDARRRKLTSGSNFGIGLPSQLGAPPVGYRMLAGE